MYDIEFKLNIYSIESEMYSAHHKCSRCRTVSVNVINR